MTINQNSNYDLALLNDALRKTLYAQINFDFDLHKLDLSDLKRMQKRRLSYKQQKALGRQEDYLSELKKKSTEEEFKQYFIASSTEIAGIPLKSDHVQWCERGEESSISSYIKLGRHSSYISIDYRSLLSGLTLELCYADVVGDFKDVNEALKDLNPVQSYSSDILRELDWLDDELYAEAKEFKVSESEYVLSRDVCRDYFLNNLAFGNTYKNMIESTAKNLICILLSHIAKECGDMKVNLQLVGVKEAGLEFVLYTEEKAVYTCVLKLLRESVIARVMGRKFCFYPTLSIINIA